MSASAHQPELIISLSSDKVTLDLSGQLEQGRSHWKTSFEVDGIFLEEQISLSLDQVLAENPILLDQFSCVEIVLLDRPNISVPRHYVESARLAEIASRHLRLRLGDTLTTDSTGTDAVFCYTMPTYTLQMLREYYANSGLTHLSSILWHVLCGMQNGASHQSITYYTLLHDTLIVLAAQNNKLIFSKNFKVRHEADLFYYSIACSRMLRSEAHWHISIENEESPYEMPGESILKMNQILSLPTLHVLMAQYKKCES